MCPIGHNHFNDILMKRFLLIIASIFCLSGFISEASNDGIHVYPAVPGLAPSEHYTFKVRTVGSSTWLDPFAFITTCKQGGETNTYYKWLTDWSNSYINFEMSNSVPVEVEISKVDGAPILTAVVHPSHAVDACEVVNGKAYVRLDQPALFTVDINGQMDAQETGRIQPDGWGSNAFYGGPPIHTVTVFANPFLEEKPALNDDNVLWISPGEMPPSDGNWDVLAFLPGIHEIGRMFRVRADKSYYIPGDAIVYGAMNNNKDWNDGHNIRIFGHGTLSGERHPHPHDDTPPAPDSDDWKYRPIEIVGARNTTVEGITIADSAMHTLMLINGYQPDQPTDIRWVKIFTWRSNGDGINPFGNTLIEDCFIRTQDDCLYVNGRGIRRVVLWTDANGSSFVLSPIGGDHGNDILVEDCDVIYNRSVFYQNKGGHVFNLRGEGAGDGGSNIIFQNIRVSDPLPTRSTFGISSGAPWQLSPNYEKSRDEGVISGILFREIDIAAYSTIGDPETLWGTALAPLSNFTFDKVTIGGDLIEDISIFNTNDYVSGMNFIGTPSLLLSTNKVIESSSNDGTISESIELVLMGGRFSDDVVSGTHIYLESVPLGLIPVMTRIDDHVISVSFSGRALSHGDRDDISNCTFKIMDEAFVSNAVIEVQGAIDSSLAIDFRDPAPTVLFRDEFGDGDITLSSNTDVIGGFNVYKSNESGNGLQIYEASDLGVLDLTDATDNFPWISMLSKSAFNVVDIDEFDCRVVVEGLAQSHWYLRPFVFNLRSNASAEPQIYHRDNQPPPQGVSLLVGNGENNCRIALTVSDGLTSEWLWEDTTVSASELADGFSFVLTMNSTNGWDIAFSGVSSLPNQVSGSWDNLQWNDFFGDSTYVQLYLREDRLGGNNPPRVGMAKAEVDEIEIKSSDFQSYYEIWSELWGGVDLSNGQQDYDQDGVSNWDEYVFNGNPTNAEHTGSVRIRTDDALFTVVHPVHQLDSDIVYRLLDTTNLVGGTWQTNRWDTRTLGISGGDYTTVSNHYSTTNILRRFIRIEAD